MHAGTAGQDIFNAYTILGIRESATKDEIRRAFLDGSRRTHPDKTGTSDTAAFRLIKQAYDTLINPRTRAAHDSTLRKQRQGGSDRRQSQHQPQRSEQSAHQGPKAQTAHERQEKQAHQRRRRARAHAERVKAQRRKEAEREKHADEARRRRDRAHKHRRPRGYQVVNGNGYWRISYNGETLREGSGQMPNFKGHDFDYVNPPSDELFKHVDPDDEGFSSSSSSDDEASEDEGSEDEDYHDEDGDEDYED